ncbi:MAG: hypothetical protein K2Y40_22225 [Reyranella sp.]|nr:hypothetical protein [Reyranella sp.]
MDSTQLAARERLRLRLREEEQSGSAFAFYARIGALIPISIMLLVAAAPNRILYSEAACAVLAVGAWVVFRFRASRWVLAIHAVVIVLEVTAIGVAAMEPSFSAAASTAWLEQAFGRRSMFLFLSVYLVGSAFSYSVIVVAMTGVACLAGLVGSFLWTAFVQARSAGIDLLAATDPLAVGLAQLGRIIGDGFVTPPSFLVHQLVLMAVITAFAAAAVWRARAHLGRTLLAESERRNLARYFSPNLVDRLAGAERDFEMGRQQRAAVLFVDIVGFTRLVEGVAPERTITFLRAFHERMAASVFAQGGTLDKFIGDGVMATFGTPDAQPDDAARALRCALDMVRSIEAWNAERQPRGQPLIRIAVGIHVGQVLMGAIGSRDRLEFSAVGDTVNVASRLEQLARVHDAAIVASVDALAAAGDAGGLSEQDKALFRGIGEVAIPGRDAPLDVAIVPRSAAV